MYFVIWIFLLSCNGFVIIYFIFNLNCIVLCWIIIWIMNFLNVLFRLKSIFFRFFSFFSFFIFLYRLADIRKDPNLHGERGTETCDGDGDGDEDEGQNLKWGWGHVPASMDTNCHPYAIRTIPKVFSSQLFFVFVLSYSLDLVFNLN